MHHVIFCRVRPPSHPPLPSAQPPTRLCRESAGSSKRFTRCHDRFVLDETDGRAARYLHQTSTLGKVRTVVATALDGQQPFVPAGSAEADAQDPTLRWWIP